MLVIRIELWPGGDASCAREIARAQVSNASHLAGISDYRCDVREAASGVTGLPDQRADFWVCGHPRKSPVWALVAKVAKQAAVRFRQDNSDVLDMWARGQTFGQISRNLGLSRSAVGGIVYRARLAGDPRADRRPSPADGDAG